MDVLIRDMQEQDYAAIMKLIRNELGYGQLPDEGFTKRLEMIRRHPDCRTFVAVQDQEVVGFVGLYCAVSYEIEGRFGRITAMAVDEKYQRHGIGKMLMQKAEAFAYQEKLTMLALNSGLQRIEAHKFYEQQGFVKKGYSFKKELHERGADHG